MLAPSSLTAFAAGAFAQPVEPTMRERVTKRLLPASTVQLDFEHTFPPHEATPASAALAAHAKRVHAELGKDLTVRERPTGGGTDAANASLKTKAPVVEGFGPRGFGAHGSDAEYILMVSIEPRLYLAAPMIVDVAQGKAPLAGR